MKKSLNMIRALSVSKNLKFVPSTSQIIGSPEDCISQLLEYYKLGINNFYIKLYDFTDFELLKLIADEIIKPMKG